MQEQELTEEQIRAIEEKLKSMPPEELKKLIKQQCLFCQITEKKIPSKIVYEDSDVLGVLDINPANLGHTLVFTKEHYQILNQVPDELLSHLFKVVNRISSRIFESLNCHGTNIFVANGQAAGQNAMHSIVHVIPRFENDKIGLSWKGKKLNDDEMNQAEQLIKEKLKDIKIEKEVKQQSVIIKKAPEALEDVKKNVDKKETKKVKEYRRIP